MNHRILLILGLAILAGRLTAQPTYGTGEVFDPEVYNALPLKAKVSTRSLLPVRASVEQYCPTAGNQGDYMTCSAWSSAYHFRTIIEAKQRGLTDRAEIDKLAFSPTWVYEILKDTLDEGCAGGLMTAKTLLVFKQLGVPSYESLPFACYDGDQAERFARLDPLMNEAAAARIRDLQILFLAREGIDPADKLLAIKKVLAEGSPVLVSHTLYDSFHAGEAVWRTKAGESEASDRHGSHAMVIVGYDDEKYGGAFRYLNSWGPEWGDNGFIWVPYATTGDLCYGAYQAFPFAPTPSENPAPITANLPAGSMEFVLRDGSPMPVTRISTRNLIVEDDAGPTPDRGAYRLKNAYPSGTRFRFYLDVDKEAYVYAFASDLTGKVNAIFPYDDQVSPLVGANSLIAFPADDKVIRMDQQPGTDYLLVLFSRTPLDPATLKQQMDAGSGGLMSRVQSALGDALLTPEQVEYTPGRAGFRARPGAGGSVVPLIVEIDHRQN